MSASNTLPAYEDVLDAAERLAPVVPATPLLRNRFLDARSGGAVFLKAEMLQYSGSFKFRGAYNRLSRLDDREKPRGVVAYSSGNHAQGVAAAAALLNIPAKIVMPEDAPRIKIDNTRAMGAEVISYDRYSESREEIARQIAERDGAVLVPSYDDFHIIAGQGTAGLELFQEVAARGESLDALLICCGGGGLSAGCGLAARALSPETDLFCVEPAAYDDHARSLRSGQRERADTSQPSLCDALLTPTPGELTFELNRRQLKGGLVVNEEEVLDAVRYAFRVLKLVVEPGGAVALAALLTDKLPAHYRHVGVLLSGGNIDPALFAEVLSGAR